MIDKKILSRYATKKINPKFYGFVNIDTKDITLEEYKQNLIQQGYVFAPWVIITTHAEIYDFKTGKFKRIRQVSYWGLFKLWLNKIIYGIKILN